MNKLNITLDSSIKKISSSLLSKKSLSNEILIVLNDIFVI